MTAPLLSVVALAAATLLAGSPPAGRAGIVDANIIDGADGRDSLLTLGPGLGLSAAEIDRIRTVSGFVGCFLPSPSVGTGTLFLTDRQVLTVAHIFFDPAGRPRSRCFFKNQAAEPVKINIDTGAARFGSRMPRGQVNADYAIVRLAEPVPGALPLPVADGVPVRTGDALMEVTAHPAGLAKDLDPAVPVIQACRVRRAPISTADTSFFRTDCDATGSSSGGIHIARVGGELVLRGITVNTGPWREPRLHGAVYDEQAGSVTTALGADAAILAAGRSLAAAPD